MYTRSNNDEAALVVVKRLANIVITFVVGKPSSFSFDIVVVIYSF